MKKIVLVVAIMALLCTAAFADHPEGVGLGGVTNLSVGNYGVVSFNPSFGLSLKVGPLPLFWGFFGTFIPGHGNGIGVTGDYYIFDNWNLVDKTATNEDGDYDVKIDWYLGVGFFANTHFWHKNVRADLGVRIPWGVSWHAMEQLEVSVGIAPGFGVFFGENVKTSFHYKIPLEISCRYWFGVN